MRETKFIGFFRLVEACGEPGCPVCRCLVGESRSYLDAVLYEHVTDPDTRRRIRASWGFCNWHTWMLLEVEQSVFGASIIYEDLLARALRRTAPLEAGPDRPRWRGWLAARLARRRRPPVVEQYRRRPACQACVSTAETERRYLDTLVRSLDDADLQLAYARSDGLCVPHLLAAVEGHGDRPPVRGLVERTRAKWARLDQELRSFIDKHDHRNRAPYSDAEAASYTRAFEALAGAKSVFGNDRPAASRDAVTAPPGGG
jgi:hypothetical protein